MLLLATLDMGKTCSKHTMLPGHRGLTVVQPCSNSRSTESDLAAVQKKSNVPSFCSLEVDPPHSLLKKLATDLPKTLKFYVHIYGLKARSLQFRSSKTDALLFCVVNWDDFSFERRTKRCTLQAHPKWGDTMQFYYSIPTIEALVNRFLTIQVYMDTGIANKSVFLGQVKVPLSTIANGPIHHDLALQPNPKAEELADADLGRLIFDVRMAQVCQLIISPVEILVHLHDSLNALDRLEVDGVGTKCLVKKLPVVETPVSDCSRAEQQQQQQQQQQQNVFSAGNRDQSIDKSFYPPPKKLNSNNSSASRNEMSASKQILSRQQKSFAPLPSKIEDAPAIHNSAPPKTTDVLSSVAALQKREAINAARHETEFQVYGSVETPIAAKPTLSSLFRQQRPKFGEINKEAGEGTPRDKDALDVLVDHAPRRSASRAAVILPPGLLNTKSFFEESLSNHSSDDIVELKIENEAVGGHSESDALDPYLAEWQLTFVPTGVDNPFEYCSAWTAMCAQPYWNSVDHSLVDRCIQENGHVSRLSTLSHAESATQHSETTATLELSNSSYLPPVPKLSHIRCSPLKQELAENAPPVENEFETLSQPLPIPTDVGRCPGSSSSQLSKISFLQQPVVVTDKSIGSHPNLETARKPALSTQASVGGYGEKLPAVSVLPTTLTQSVALKSFPLGHLDPQATYRKLAALCSEGKLVREMLYGDLPTVQLETTCDFLRQNHLILRLYAKRSGLQAPEFYAEAWLPFFKIYDADVVEESRQNFSGSYFHEKLWFEGKCIGHIEGLITFQNNPMVRQMVAGVHTDQGFMRISPPILGTKTKSLKSLLRRRQGTIPEEIQKLSQLHQVLLDILYQKAQHVPTEAARLIPIRSAERPNQNGWLSFFGLCKYTKKKGFKKVTNKICKETLRITSAPQLDDSNVPQQELHNVCDQLLELLRLSHVETRRSFLYRTQGSLLTGQQVFLDLANHVLEFVDYVPWQYRSTYSAFLHQILRRSELDIGSCLPEPLTCMFDLDHRERHMLYLAVKNKFSKKSEERSSSENLRVAASAVSDKTYLRRQSLASPKIYNRAQDFDTESLAYLYEYHQRMKMCKQYYVVLHRVLHTCFAKLCSESGFEGQRKYISIFLCILYFRLPKFRDELLECILTEEHRQSHIEEWRGTEFRLDADSLKQFEEWQNVCEYRLMLDWTPFHKSLKEYFGENNLAESFKNWPPPLDLWKSVLRERGPPFFSLLEHWAKQVFQCISFKDSLRWQTLPGYASLLKAFLLEMKSRDVTRYPDALLNCSGAFLANEKLLSVFVKILFLKTSVHNIHAVFAALNYVDYWIQVLALRNQSLPPNFDLHFLGRGLDIVFGSDLGLCVSKGIWFVYKNLTLFQAAPIKLFLIDLLFQKYFFTFFLHWSWLVRRCFMWIILYRVCETTRRLLTATGNGTHLTEEEKMLAWAYMELCRYLRFLSGPDVFPPAVVLAQLPKLILNAIPVPSEYDCSHEPKNHRASEEQKLALQSSREINTNAATSLGDFQWTTEDSVSLLKPSFRPHNDLNSERDDTRPPYQMESKTKSSSANRAGQSRLEPHIRAMVSRVHELMRQGVYKKEDFCIPHANKTYIKLAVPEFIIELQTYSQWVACGASSVPQMNIPLSPLDNNVDVPLDPLH